MAPAHTRGIRTEEVDPAREALYRGPRSPLVPKPFKTIRDWDVRAFGTMVHRALQGNTAGYILQVRQHGKLVYHMTWNGSRTPVDGNRAWNEDTRMHVGSVSKFLTAVGLVKLLDSKGISCDAKIADYLPAYWAKGPNVEKITFRHLLTHRSGFGGVQSASDYLFMKSKVAAGVATVGAYDYENMNFGLCRILMPILRGDISRDRVFTPSDLRTPATNDHLWDVVTLYHYRNYMQANVFAPAGVQNAGFAPPRDGQGALAYPFPHANKPGWDSGDLCTMAGGAGWRLSTRELLNVLDHVRRRNTILPAPRAQYLLDNHFGIDLITDTPAGRLYDKNGLWCGNSRVEQCLVEVMPGQMEAVVFVNSPIGTDGSSLRGVVGLAFLASLK
jgi:CubicO group peptidase (beta-lactamase class C family)